MHPYLTAFQQHALQWLRQRRKRSVYFHGRYVTADDLRRSAELARQLYWEELA